MTAEQVRKMLFLAKFLDDNPGLLKEADIRLNIELLGQKPMRVIRDDEALMGWSDNEFGGSFRWVGYPPEMEELTCPFVVVTDSKMLMVTDMALVGSALKGRCRPMKPSDYVLMSCK